MPSPVERFVFDIFKPLTNQLAEHFNRAPTVKLSERNLAEVPQVPGVYGLWLKGVLAYVGKTDSSLGERLGQHFRKLRLRQNLNIDDVKFCALEMSPDLAPVVSETILINRLGGTAIWQKSGIGSNPTGKERFTQKPSNFNKRHPIRHDWPCKSVSAGQHTVLDLLKAIKAELEKGGFFWPEGNAKGLSAPAQDGKIISLADKVVDVPQAGMGAWALLKLLEKEFPHWRAVRFDGWLMFWPRFESKGGKAVKRGKFTHELS